MDFLKGAKDLARNPLGIIALFISLIYGFANLLLGSSADKLTAPERWPIIIFIVTFPILVLVTFYKLVTKHHGKLYAPGDFKDDKSFLRTLSPEEQERKLEKEVKESFTEINGSPENPKPAQEAASFPEVNSQEAEKEREEYQSFRNDLQFVESAVVEKIAKELGTQPDSNVGLGGSDVEFDAFLQMHNGKATFLEVKALRKPSPAFHIIERLLYSAVVADKFFSGDFKLIIAVVYYFDSSDLKRVERFWRNKIDKCPADIEVRFIHRDELRNA